MIDPIDGTAMAQFFQKCPKVVERARYGLKSNDPYLLFLNWAEANAKNLGKAFTKLTDKPWPKRLHGRELGMNVRWEVESEFRRQLVLFGKESNGS